MSTSLKAVQDGYTNSTRRSVRRLVAPLGRVNPNLVTLTGVSLCVLSAVPVVISGRNPRLCFWLAAAAFFVGAMCDVADGAIAKRFGKESPVGTFFDSSVDRIGEAAMVGGWCLLFIHQHNEVAAGLALAAVVGSVMVSYERAQAELMGMNGDVGLGKRAERCAIIIAALVLAPWLDLKWAAGFLAVTAWFTVGWRIKSVRSQLQAKAKEAS